VVNSFNHCMQPNRWRSGRDQICKPKTRNMRRSVCWYFIQSTNPPEKKCGNWKGVQGGSSIVGKFVVRYRYQDKNKKLSNISWPQTIAGGMLLADDFRWSGKGQSSMPRDEC
jgi:hypothetical protein